MTQHQSQTSYRPVDGRLKVVLVDDHATTVKLASYIFQEDGWEVYGFTSPLMALEALKNFEPDLIVSDFRMPGMNGPEFLLAAGRLHELTPGLIMTAYDDDSTVASDLRKAAVPSVSKADGLTELLIQARKLVSVRQTLKSKPPMTFSASA